MKRNKVLLALTLLALTLLALWWRTSTPPSMASSDDAGSTKRVAELGTRPEDAPDASFEPLARLTGLVQDTAKTPLPNARVRLLADHPKIDRCEVCELPVTQCDEVQTLRELLARLRAGSVPSLTILAETRTDAAGHFRFPDFAELPWSALIVADLEGRVDSITARRLDATLTLETDKHRLLTVTDELEQPIAGARLTAWSELTGEVQHFTSDELGVFSLPELSRDVWLGVDADGYLPQITRLILGSVMLSKPRSLDVRTLRGEEPVDADVMLEGCGHPRHAHAVQGVAHFEGLHGPCEASAKFENLSAGPRPTLIEGPLTTITLGLVQTATLRVTVHAPLSVLPRTISAFLRTESSAVEPSSEHEDLFTFVVPEGKYELEAVAPGTKRLRRELDLKGESSLEVTLEPLPRVRGQVLDADGRPVSGAELSVPGDLDNIRARAVSDAKGHFEIDLVGAGPWLLHAASETEGEGDAPATEQSQELVITLDRGGGIEVTVTGTDGKALPADCDLTSRSNPDLMRWVPETGVLAAVPAGVWTLEKDLEGHLPVRELVTISPGQVTRVHLGLDRSVSVFGKVLDHRGKPVAEASVSVAGSEDVEVETDSRGNFELTPLPRGAVEIEASSLFAEPVRVKVTAPAKNVVITLKQPPMISGRVIDEARQVVSKFEVNGQEVVRADGRFSAPLIGGTLDVSAFGFADLSRTGQRPGEVGDVVLTRLPRVKGEVVDEQGAAVAGAMVIDPDEGTSTITDVDGRFQLALATLDTTELVATKGSLAGRVELDGKPVRITLTEGRRVLGFVHDAQGKPAPGVRVDAQLDQRTASTATSDTNGRFELRLEEALWRFSLDGSPRTRVVEVRGESTEVVLSTAGEGTCAFVAQVGQIAMAWVIPGGLGAGVEPLAAANSTPGAVQLATPGLLAPLKGDQLACGQAALVLIRADGSVTAHPMSLTGGVQRFNFPGP